MTRVFVPLEIEERNALRIWAEREKRDPRLLAAYVIRLALERAGYLQPTTPPAPQLTPQEARHAEPT